MFAPYERLPNEFQTVPKLLLRVTYESQVHSSSFTKRAGRVNSDPEVGFAPATRLASLPPRLDPKDTFSGCEQVTDDGTTSVQPWPSHGRTTSVCDVVVMSSFPSDLRQPPNRIVQSNEWEVRQHFHLRRNPTTSKTRADRVLSKSYDLSCRRKVRVCSRHYRDADESQCHPLSLILQHILLLFRHHKRTSYSAFVAVTVALALSVTVHEQHDANCQSCVISGICLDGQCFWICQSSTPNCRKEHCCLQHSSSFYWMGFFRAVVHVDQHAFGRRTTSIPSYCLQS